MCKYSEEMLERPTPDLINMYIDLFDKEEEYVESTVDAIFSNPDNSILTRVVVLNSLYSTRLNNKQINDYKKVNVKTMAEYIEESKEFFNNTCHKNIDVIHWVDNARDYFKSKWKYSPYSFLTKYCAWSFPNLSIPIVDSYTKAMLYYLNQLYHFYNEENTPHFSQTDISNKEYAFFCEVFAKFKEKYANDKTYKDIDKFLWYYGKHGKEGVNKPIQF
jgi:hypothetical protein